MSQQLEIKVNEMIDNIYCELEELHPLYDNDCDYTVYFGYCGTALAAYNLFVQRNQQKYIEFANKLTDLAVENLKGKGISFLTGDAGPLALGIVLNLRLKNIEKADSLVQRLIDLGESDEIPEVATYYKKQKADDEEKIEPKCNITTSSNNDFISGRAGYLYALLYVNQECNESVIPDEILREHVQKILYSGYLLAREICSQQPLVFVRYGEQFLGASHGAAGILYVLLIANRYMTNFELHILVKKTIEKLIVDRKPFFDYAITERCNNSDELVQWCHGAPGFFYLLTHSNFVFKCPVSARMAVECADIIWNRGLSRKGYSLCHGVAGNAYIFLSLYRLTDDPAYLYRAACFADWCTKYPHCEGLKPVWRYSLFQGIAGLLCFLVDMKQPTKALFPGYELYELEPEQSDI